MKKSPLIQRHHNRSYRVYHANAAQIRQALSLISIRSQAEVGAILGVTHQAVQQVEHVAINKLIRKLGVFAKEYFGR